MPTEHYYQLKTMVMRQMQREFPNSKFDRPSQVDEEIKGRVEEKISAIIEEESNFALSMLIKNDSKMSLNLRLKSSLPSMT